jgi:hypothetical protein
MVIGSVHGQASADLFFIIDTLNPYCADSRGVQYRQKHSRQYCDDGDDDKQLNQRKGPGTVNS